MPHEDQQQLEDTAHILLVGPDGEVKVDAHAHELQPKEQEEGNDDQ